MIIPSLQLLLLFLLCYDFIRIHANQIRRGETLLIMVFIISLALIIHDYLTNIFLNFRSYILLWITVLTLENLFYRPFALHNKGAKLSINQKKSMEVLSGFLIILALSSFITVVHESQLKLFQVLPSVIGLSLTLMIGLHLFFNGNLSLPTSFLVLSPLFLSFGVITEYITILQIGKLPVTAPTYLHILIPWFLTIVLLSIIKKYKTKKILIRILGLILVISIIISETIATTDILTLSIKFPSSSFGVTFIIFLLLLLVVRPQINRQTINRFYIKRKLLLITEIKRNVNLNNLPLMLLVIISLSIVIVYSIYATYSSLYVENVQLQRDNNTYITPLRTALQYNGISFLGLQKTVDLPDINIPTEAIGTIYMNIESAIPSELAISIKYDFLSEISGLPPIYVDTTLIFTITNFGITKIRVIINDELRTNLANAYHLAIIDENPQLQVDCIKIELIHAPFFMLSLLTILGLGIYSAVSQTVIKLKESDRK